MAVEDMSDYEILWFHENFKIWQKDCSPMDSRYETIRSMEMKYGITVQNVHSYLEPRALELIHERNLKAFMEELNESS